MYNKPLPNTRPIEPSALYRCLDASCLLGGISRSTLARWRVVGCGPKFVKVGRMAKGYDDFVIQDWLTRILSGGRAGGNTLDETPSMIASCSKKSR